VLIRPLIVGHRGASALAPENTLRAFEVAIEHGLDMAELDVHLSRDGQLVVIHDADLLRVAARPDRVADCTADQLAAFDVPRLTEVCFIARGRLAVYVELKGPRTGLALAELVRSGAADGVKLISGSFLPSLVAELKAAAPEVPRSVLFARTSVEHMLTTCREVQATYAHPCFRPIDQAMVDTLHAAGLHVMTPHTNDAVEAQQFKALGVDVIASDDPRVLAGVSFRGGAEESRCSPRDPSQRSG
jgi:glycerophosphoryl diester phosphodiesterase